MTKYTPGNQPCSAASQLQSSLHDCMVMRARPKPEAAACPIRDTLDQLGNKWTILVVIALTGHTRRFSELRRDIPDISQRMLTQTLRDLERAGLVEREQHPTVPPRVDYRLSPLGLTFLDPLASLIGWAGRNRQAMSQARSAFDAAVV